MPHVPTLRAEDVGLDALAVIERSGRHGVVLVDDGGATGVMCNTDQIPHRVAVALLESAMGCLRLELEAAKRLERPGGLVS